MLTQGQSSAPGPTDCTAWGGKNSICAGSTMGQASCWRSLLDPGWAINPSAGKGSPQEHLRVRETPFRLDATKKSHSTTALWNRRSVFSQQSPSGNAPFSFASLVNFGQASKPGVTRVVQVPFHPASTLWVLCSGHSCPPCSRAGPELLQALLHGSLLLSFILGEFQIKPPKISFPQSSRGTQKLLGGH